MSSEIPTPVNLKDRFAAFGDSIFDTQESYENAITKIKAMFNSQVAHFNGIADELKNLAEDPSLPESEKTKFSEAAGKATALASEISVLAKDAPGIFVEYQEITSREQRLADLFGEFTYDQLNSADLSFVREQWLINDSVQYNLRGSQVSDRVKSLEYWNPKATSYDTQSETVKGLANNYSEAVILSEAVEYVGLALDIIATGTGSIIGKKAIGKIVQESAEFGLSYYFDVPTTTLNMGFAVLDEASQDITENSQLLDEFQTTTGIIVILAETQKDFSTGFIDDTFFAVAVDGVDGAPINLNDVTTWQSIKNVMLVGSEGVDIIKVPLEVPGNVSISLRGGDDNLVVDLVYAFNTQFQTIYAGTGNDTLELLGNVIEAYGESDDDEFSIRHAADANLFGGSGDDQFNISYSTIGSIEGGLGFDTLDISNNKEELREDSMISYDTGFSATIDSDGIYLEYRVDLGNLHAESIERVIGTENADKLLVKTDGLDLDVEIDFGASRRTQAEIDELNANLPDGQAPYVLEPNAADAFLYNVDTVDYSALTTGLMYYNGQTALRLSGGFIDGSSVRMNSFDETRLMDGSLKDIHNLKVENVEKIILTDGDDTFVGAAKGSIVDLGGGADKVWLRPDILVENFGLDDRLTLFGELALYGGYRNAESELPWAEGVYGTRYAINPALDLVVHNPWATGNNDYMFITNWQDQKGDVKAIHDAGQYGTGPGDIALSKFSFRSSTLNDLIKGNNPPAGDGESILALWALMTKIPRNDNEPTKADQEIKVGS
ncbi:MAG: hypothetical protein GY743_18470, partial [Planctomycetaceae bacterium]|nr:hypothetical protein [Planctomycetaceae bacterium]